MSREQGQEHWGKVGDVLGYGSGRGRGEASLPCLPLPPSSPRLFSWPSCLAFLSGLLVCAFLGWSPLARRSETQGGLAFGAQSWRCRPTHVPLETSRSWGLQVYLGPGAPLQEDGAPVSQVTHITSCHILHHLGVQPPPQRAPPVCIFLEGVRRECSFIQ